MHKMHAILATRAEPNFFTEDQLTLFLKSQATPVTTVKRIHDTNNKPLHIVGWLILYVHVRRLKKRVFTMCEWFAIPAIFGCDLCDQMDQCIYLRTRSVKLIDGSTVYIVCPYEGQQSTNTVVPEKLSFQKLRDAPSPKFDQHNACIFLQSVVLTAQTVQEVQILVARRCSARKRTKWRAARRIQDVKRNVSVQIIIANFSRKNRQTFKNQVVVMAAEVSMLLIAATKTSLKILGIMENRKSKKDNCQEIPEEIQELSFPHVNANHHESIRKTPTPFADMWSRKLRCINAIKHLTELTPISCPFNSAPHGVGPKIRELEELEVQKQFMPDVIKPATSKLATPVLFVPKEHDFFRLCIYNRNLKQRHCQRYLPITSYRQMHWLFKCGKDLQRVGCPKLFLANPGERK